MSDEMGEFLRFWYEGWEQSLPLMEPACRSAMLEKCGRACAASYTAEIFRQAAEESATLADLAEALNQRFTISHFEVDEAGSLVAHYTHCGCPLVESGWVKDPLLCECSLVSLQANMEAAIAQQPALGDPAAMQVTLYTSMLEGDDECLLKVAFA